MNEDIKPNLESEAMMEDEMLDEYDFSQAIRGNPYKHLNQSPVKIK
jgi:hypothetical protein